MKWHYLQAGEQKGPVEIEFLKELVRKGELVGTDYVWNQNMGEKWTRVDELPILGVPPATIKPGTDETFKQRLEERQENESHERTLGRIKGVVAALAAIGLVALGVVWFQGKPFRKWGINRDNPVGTHARIVEQLKNVDLMSESAVERHASVTKAADRVHVYNNPKAQRGMFVSRQGNIYLFADAQERLKGLLVEYPTPGIRGGSQVNPCVASLFIEDYWVLLADGTATKHTRQEPVPADLAATFGLIPPEKASWASFENGQARGLWLAYGPQNGATLIIIQNKDW